MRRTGSRFRYYLVEAWEEFRHSPGPNLLAAGVLSATLFVASSLLLVLANVSATLQDWGNRLRVDVFLTEGAPEQEIADLARHIERLEGVLRVTRVDKEQALGRFRAAFHTLADVPEELGENPLPESLEAYLNPADASSTGLRVLAAVRGSPVVDDVRWDRPVMDRLTAAHRFARWGGGILGAVVLGALTLVMAGVLRLAVLARREEIEIMRLVGASPGMVRGPFLLAGAIQGAVGALVAMAVLEGARQATLDRAFQLGSLADGLLGSPLPLRPSLAVLVMGIAIGVASAWFAVGAYGRPPQPQKSKTM